VSDRQVGMKGGWGEWDSHDAAEEEGVNFGGSLLDGDDRVVLFQEENRHLCEAQR
jgi:hypothetical protein